MPDQPPTGESLEARFEANRPRLVHAAYRMLGSRTEAEDAVQEAWLRLAREDPGSIGNLAAWLTTVVSRVCLDWLRTRKVRREDTLDVTVERHGSMGRIAHPELDLLRAEGLSLALLAVLEQLAPTERVAFVLHDSLGMSFEEIAPIVERSPAATRQLASRARRRLQPVSSANPESRGRQQALVRAFLEASRAGNLQALLSILHPDAVLRGDESATAMGAAAKTLGAAAVAETFKGRAQVAQLCLIDGAPGLVWAPGGEPRVLFQFTIRGEFVESIELTASPEAIGKRNIVLLP
ncbi:MAG: sigma-70 family RNA polymerase sigma factor [Bryobacterales bacterium]|nr:sigma-70 family RNA polymerase sigma factor [Bryobacterales bacterium]